jgi:hypothetical protein
LRSEAVVEEVLVEASVAAVLAAVVEAPLEVHHAVDLAEVVVEASVAVVVLEEDVEVSEELLQCTTNKNSQVKISSNS